VFLSLPLRLTLDQWVRGSIACGFSGSILTQISSGRIPAARFCLDFRRRGAPYFPSDYPFLAHDSTPPGTNSVSVAHGFNAAGLGVGGLLPYHR
jgi:hypothetical protein